MHIHHDHIAGGDHSHSHEHTHTHEHTHDGVTHTHEHCHAHEHGHTHPHEHDHLHGEGHTHEHSHDCAGECGGCSGCQHTPMEELTALMQYMANHNAAHARELAELAVQLQKAGNPAAYEQVMAAVSDFEKGNLRLTAVLASLK
ncbi:MAG: cobalt transporter [Oscillospiraceae bacterium]|nr:cobalt transporter [Oscillospiraceae bacterium]